MRATVWHGKRDVRIDDVPDPAIQDDTDAVIRVTSSGLCGSDLHLYEVLTPFMTPGDVLGHEPMGVVEEVGPAVTDLRPGDRVVVPFRIACGTCWMCRRGLRTQCETTQVTEHGMGARLFGCTELYGAVPGAQAEYLRVPQAQYGPIKVPGGPPDDRFVCLSDVLPTAWQAVAYADVPRDGSLVVLGLGPIGAMACRIARHPGVAGGASAPWQQGAERSAVPAACLGRRGHPQPDGDQVRPRPTCRAARMRTTTRVVASRTRVPSASGASVGTV